MRGGDGGRRRPRERRGRPALIAAATALALLLVPAAAPAAPTWLAPQRVSAPGQESVGPTVAMDAAGGVVAAWLHSGGIFNDHVEASFRAAGPGQSFTAPQVISGKGSLIGIVPEVAVDPQGNAIAIVTLAGSVEAAFRPAGGSFGAPQAISPPGSNQPRVAFDAEGNAIAVWERQPGGNHQVEAAFRPAGGVFGAPQVISNPAANSRFPELAVGPRGDAVVTWISFAGVGDQRIEAALRPPGGGFGAPQLLTKPGQEAKLHQVGIDAQGNAVAVWTRWDGAYLLEAAYGSVAAGFGAPHGLAGKGAFVSQPQLAVNPDGHAIAVWTRGNGGLEDHIEGSFRPAGGSFGPVQDISGETNSNFPSVAIDPNGNALTVWRRYDGTRNHVEASYRPLAGPFGPAVPVSPADQSADDAAVATDAQGNAVTVWRNGTAVPYQIEAAGFDAAGPQLRNLSIPATAERGKPASFSVSPFDVWSQVASTGWSFGDGASAQGEAVKHAFRKIGRFQVTVTSTDSLGNSSTATATVRVRDTIKPRISKLRVTPRAVRPAGKGGRKGARGSAAPKGRKAKGAKGPKAKIRFRLSEPARVTFTVKRQVRKRCGKRRCLKLVRVKGKLTAKGRQGQNAVPFKGRVGGRALAPGRYVLTAQAKDPAGRKSKPAKVAFRVIR